MEATTKTQKQETEKEDKQEKTKREIVIPGEAIVSGSEYLPGDHTVRDGNEIIATRFGLADISGRLIRVIPLSGVYTPRKGNSIVGKVVDITFNGWILEIDSPYLAFLPVAEVNKYVDKNNLTEFLDLGEMVVASVSAVKHRGVDLTLKGRGLGKLEDGIIIKINSNKVPRVIGREGSMVNLIKRETTCSIIVGQNGLIWIRGKSVEAELLAKEVILFIVEKSFIEGLTEKVKEFLEKKAGSKKEEKK